MKNKKLLYTAGLLIFLAPLILNAQEKKDNSKHYNPHSLASHGYLRTGLGRSLSGGEMVQFQLPGTIVKSRFGNEANHYSELQFDYKYQPENSSQSCEVVYMMDTYLPYTTKNLAKSIKGETAQLYFKWNNIYNGMDVWIGRRYYNRINIDILDWFWLNSAQLADAGAGIENIKLFNNQTLNIALLRFSEEIQEPVNKGKLLENHKLDIRWQGIKLGPELELNILGQLGHRPKLKNTQYKSLTGYSLGAWTSYKKGSFYNRTSAIYRTGINIISNPYSGKPLLEFDAAGTHLFDLDKAEDLQITSDFRYDDHEKNGFLGAVIYHHRNYGVKTAENNDKTMDHINITGRYTRYISKNFNLTMESSYGRVSHKDGVSGGLFKVSFSPQFSWGKGMFSRPALRPFITYAAWSKDLQGSTGVFNGNDVYADKTSGFTVGLQLEIWW